MRYHLIKHPHNRPVSFIISRMTFHVPYASYTICDPIWDHKGTTVVFVFQMLPMRFIKWNETMQHLVGSAIGHAHFGAVIAKFRVSRWNMSDGQGGI